jgi:hypothetical protein
MISRRRLLQTAGCAAVALGHGRAAKLSAIGVQLYTVRSVMPAKMDETLRAVEAAGYREIEATWAGLDALLAALKNTRLKPVSVHLDSKLLGTGSPDEVAKAVEQAKRGGFDFAVHPYVPPAERGGLDAMKVLAQKLNQAGEKFRAAGISLCYHNHAFEFEPINGTTPFQVLLDNTDKKLVGIEMDVFWVSVAGHDPVEMLGKLSGRGKRCAHCLQGSRQRRGGLAQGIPRRESRRDEALLRGTGPDPWRPGRELAPEHRLSFQAGLLRNQTSSSGF